jgi:hypothetical protein
MVRLGAGKAGAAAWRFRETAVPLPYRAHAQRLAQAARASCGGACRWCGSALSQNVEGYEHEGGWELDAEVLEGGTAPSAPASPGTDPRRCPLRGQSPAPPSSEWERGVARYWLFVTCSGCGYQWALWKLGLPVRQRGFFCEGE